MVQTSSLSTTSITSPISPILPQSPAAGEAEPEPDIPNRRPGLDGLQDDVKSDDTKGGDGDEKEVEVTVLEKGGRGGMMNKVSSPLSHSPMLPRRPPPAAPSSIRFTCFIVLTPSYACRSVQLLHGHLTQKERLASASSPEVGKGTRALLSPLSDAPRDSWLVHHVDNFFIRFLSLAPARRWYGRRALSSTFGHSRRTSKVDQASPDGAEPFPLPPGPRNGRHRQLWIALLPSARRREEGWSCDAQEAHR